MQLQNIYFHLHSAVLNIKLISHVIRTIIRDAVQAVTKTQDYITLKKAVRAAIS